MACNNIMYIVYLFRYGPMPHAGSSNLLVSILLTAAAWGAHARTEQAGYYVQSNDNTWVSVRGKSCHCVDIRYVLITTLQSKLLQYLPLLIWTGWGQERHRTHETPGSEVTPTPPRPHVPPSSVSAPFDQHDTRGWHQVSGNPTLFRDRICLPASF